jgi:hypothetical protein
MPQSLYVPCTIERGAFSNERVFKISLSSAEGVLFGTANVRYLRDGEGQPLGDDPTYGEMMGFVQCHIISSGEGTVTVEVPSTDIIHISETELVEFD